jgi:hypothetical protein
MKATRFFHAFATILSSGIALGFSVAQEPQAPITQEQFERKLIGSSGDDIKLSIGVLEMLVGSLIRQVEAMRAQHGERGAKECCKVLNTIFNNALTSISNASCTIESQEGQALLVQKLQTLPSSELAQLQESLAALTTSLEKTDFIFKNSVQRYIKALLACMSIAEQERIA